MNATVTMSTKGQIVIPREVREQLGWGTGTRLEVVSQAGAVLIRPVRAFPQKRVDDLLGLLPYDGPPKSIEEMNEAIAKGATRSTNTDK